MSVSRRMTLIVLTVILALGMTTVSTFAASHAKVKSVKVNKTSVTLNVGSKTTIKAVVKGPCKCGVKWKSSNTKIAKVSSKGVVTAVGAGKVKITAVAKKNSKKKATCTVTVKKINQSVKAPTVEVAKTTTTQIALKAQGTNYRYRIAASGQAWQSSNVFTGLKPGKEYAFQQKKIGTYKYNESPVSDTAYETTLKTPSQTLRDELKEMGADVSLRNTANPNLEYVRLNADFEIPQLVNVPKDAVLDLDGHTLTVKGTLSVDGLVKNSAFEYSLYALITGENFIFGDNFSRISGIQVEKTGVIKANAKDAFADTVFIFGTRTHRGSETAATYIAGAKGTYDAPFFYNLGHHGHLVKGTAEEGTTYYWAKTRDYREGRIMGWIDAEYFAEESGPM